MHLEDLPGRQDSSMFGTGETRSIPTVQEGYFSWIYFHHLGGERNTSLHRAFQP